MTKDKLIRKRPLELAALLKANVGAFILTSGNLTGEEMGKIFVLAHNRMLKFLDEHEKPFIASVRKDGSIHLIEE